MKTIPILALLLLASATSTFASSSTSDTETTTTISLKEVPEAPNRIRKRESQINTVQKIASNESQRRLSGWWSILSKLVHCP
eukprot:CAMPEP_0197241186 /NCGR_PEP_ID=MMETSP1429-20130617/7296_1 /TAXON_ID=49237 /ORGANISM="Chaetoceros  sp., Strain UNC1202" /LENGTH=81 /DNA_ID=CAMNT_0042700987 /DNA_START=33 /DNA_END=274 /DNA_ORIENTATION=-